MPETGRIEKGNITDNLQICTFQTKTKSDTDALISKLAKVTFSLAIGYPQ